MSLAARLLTQAVRTPASIAVADNFKAYTFAQFSERVMRVAQGLNNLVSLTCGSRVLLFMENRTEFLEILFACWHQGLVAVPVNARLHPKEVIHIAGNAEIAAAFVSARHAEVAASLRAFGTSNVIDVDGPDYAAMLDAPPAPITDVTPDRLAWLFYTSGTTGRPKGAMLSHRNLEFMCEAYYADLGLPEPGDTQLHAAPLSHGAGMYALPHLLAGGRQQVMAQFEPAEVIEAISFHKGVSFFAAPTMVMRMVNYPEARRDRFAPLKFIVYGGAPMYVADLERALDLLGPRLYQLYGQGEAPMTITGLAQKLHIVDAPAERQRVLASCGYPRTGVEVAVFGVRGEALPAGDIGEIVTRSPCVMSGYWRDEPGTQAVLRNGWLYTGDVGTLSEDGLLTLSDRSKDMIISGGSNVYPREIEEVLLRHPAVRECAVVGKPDREWGELPVAFVVAATSEPLDVSSLERFMLEHLARFKRPRDWYVVDNLPKNNYGKVLKTELRQRLLSS